jgi:hypothetical protein
VGETKYFEIIAEFERSPIKTIAPAINAYVKTTGEL